MIELLPIALAFTKEGTNEIESFYFGLEKEYTCSIGI